MPAETSSPTRWRTILLYAGPLLFLLVLAMLPLIRGTETLYLRDVLNSHLPMKWSQAEALRHGAFPLIDPYRGGGQPMAGNLNAVPFYPSNLLYLTASTFWAFNAHFWLHLLLAPLAFYWMGRAWGLGREASWAAAACWATSGFLLSHLNFYNLIAGVSLAPALVAACLGLVRPGGPRRALLAPAAALLWTLLLLGGDPQTALLAFLLTIGAVTLLWRERAPGSGWRTLGLLAAAFACGTLIALPQLVEFLRILPLSYRGHVGYGAKNITLASWDPRQIAEWFLPFVFGRPDLRRSGSLWGLQFSTGVPPYFFSLYPGLLALALITISGRPRARAAWWAWGGIAFGVFFSLGRYNPVAEWILTLPIQKSLRYPVKFWLPVAAGAALLCGLGFERLRAASLSEAAEDPARRPRIAFRRILLLLALLFTVLLAVLLLAPGPVEAWLKPVIRRDAEFITNERLRWAALSVTSLLVLAALGTALRVSRRSWRIGGALLIAVHAAAQLWFLRPLYATDAVKPYLVPSPALAWVPAGLLVVNPDYNYIFGPSTLHHGQFPDPRTLWLERRSFFEIYPLTSPVWGRRYDLNSSPEGLDTFLERRAQAVVTGSKNPQRLQLLAAWGVGRLVLNHPIEPVPPHARLIKTLPSFGHKLFIFEVTDRAPEVFLARRVFRERDLAAVYRRLTAPGFVPRTDAVLMGSPTSLRQTAGGTVRVLRQGPEEMEIETAAGPGGSLLVVQRADLLFKATIDGRPARVLTANAFRVGLEVPAGRHRVRLYVDRGPLHRSLLGTLAGLLLLPALVAWGRRIFPIDTPRDLC